MNRQQILDAYNNRLAVFGIKPFSEEPDQGLVIDVTLSDYPDAALVQWDSGPKSWLPFESLSERPVTWPPVARV